MDNIFCVIMAGGVGQRYWPLSREDKPKQFIDILGTGKTFIRQTYERFSPMIKDENFIVVTSERYLDQVLEQLPEINPSQVLCEPMRRNTAPCVAYAAHRINKICKDAIMVVTPSDHLVLNSYKFEKTISLAIKQAKEAGSLTTIGIKPSRPETGYGYIQVDTQNINEDDVLKVKTFTEKPDKELAKVFVECGEFLWNSGIFTWSVNSIMDAIKTHTPDIDSLFSQGEEIYGTDKELDFIQEIYPTCQNISIDYGIMEKADNVDVVCADFGWSDVGTWRSLYELSEKDENGNASIDNNAILYGSSSCVVRAPKDKIVVIDGLENYIVVDSEDALLITPIEKEQDIKKYIEDVRRKNGEKFL